MSNLDYDPCTLIGQARLHAADTDASNATFSDAELSYFLGVADQNPILAAAWALESLAADSARLATVIKIQLMTQDAQELSNTYAARARTLREQAGVAGSVSPYDQAFSLDNGGSAVPGSMTGW